MYWDGLPRSDSAKIGCHNNLPSYVGHHDTTNTAWIQGVVELLIPDSQIVATLGEDPSWISGESAASNQPPTIGVTKQATDSVKYSIADILSYVDSVKIYFGTITNPSSVPDSLIKTITDGLDWDTTLFTSVSGWKYFDSNVIDTLDNSIIENDSLFFIEATTKMNLLGLEKIEP